MAKSTKNKKVIATTNGSTNLTSTGQVKLSVLIDGKTIKQKTNHNTGKPILFKFLAWALAGYLQTTDRPTKIILFSGDDTESPANPEFSEDKKISIAMPYTNSTIPEKIFDTTFTDKIIGYSTTYHFIIPSAYISSNKIYKLALFPNAPAFGIEDNHCAEFLLVKDGSEAGTKEWDPWDLSSFGTKNYSLVIDWTISIQNK